MNVWISLSAALVGALFTSEIGRWPATISRSVIQRSASMLPSGFADRYKEEWLAELATIKTGIGQLAFSSRILIEIPRMRRLLTKASISTDEAINAERVKAKRLRRSTLVFGSAILSLALGVSISYLISTAASDWQSIAVASGGVVAATAAWVAAYTRELPQKQASNEVDLPVVIQLPPTHDRNDTSS
ncbi:hypothetical protein ACR9E3_24430 [Actinomycetospora sp. C-140]